jgi:uncharacterized membrane protein YbaN (DUF454 family)
MKGWELFHKIIGVLFILIGVVFYFTPLPGTTLLIIIGFIWLVGKNKTIHFTKEILGKKLFKSLKIKWAFEKVKKYIN